MYPNANKIQIQVGVYHLSCIKVTLLTDKYVILD